MVTVTVLGVVSVEYGNVLRLDFVYVFDMEKTSLFIKWLRVNEPELIVKKDGVLFGIPMRFGATSLDMRTPKVQHCLLVVFILIFQMHYFSVGPRRLGYKISAHFIVP